MGVILIVVLVVVIGGIVIALFGWDRYSGGRRRSATVGTARPTDEVFLEPDTGRRMRVWFNDATGEREYRPE